MSACLVRSQPLDAILLPFTSDAVIVQQTVNVAMTVGLGVAYLRISNTVYEAETRIVVRQGDLSLEDRQTPTDRQFAAIWQFLIGAEELR